MQNLEFIYIFQKNKGKPEHHIFPQIEIHMAFFYGIHHHDTMALNAGQNSLRMPAGFGISALIANGAGI
jgi:hypothetical protein